MGKILFWIVVVFVVLFVLRMLNVAKNRTRTPRKPADAPEAMVRCARCGVFLPKSEARSTAAGYRCADPKCLADATR